MSKHTPGPWFTEDNMFGDDVYDSTTVYAEKDIDGHGPVVVCELHDRPTARLIAAAPELLAALKALNSQGVLQSDDSSLGPYFEQAFKVIRKAEGK